MDDPNITMEEYIKLEEEKARRHGRVFNWQTTTYGKIRIDDDLHDLSSVEAEFPAIVINDAFAPQDALQCKSQENRLGRLDHGLNRIQVKPGKDWGRLPGNLGKTTGKPAFEWLLESGKEIRKT
ncbi:hypothetical protein Tco_0909175 [Tanacetum coccineum]|uniref:Uncharacterized protein n=1 Tax=Tanacetum coccineum TaxID=301880 RepID=A0ABQ5CQC2_9ASTR